MGWSMRCTLVFGVAAVACSDRELANEGGGSGEGGSRGGSTMTASTTDVPDTGEVDTGMPDVWAACAEIIDYEECAAAGCMFVSPAVDVVDRESCTVSFVYDGLCVPIGDAPTPEVRTAYYRRDGDRVWFFPIGSHCGYLDSIPPGLTECGSGADDPPECACFCHDDACPWTADFDAVEACAVPDPCGVYMPNGDPEGYAGTELCFLATLRDRTVATLSVDLNLGDFGEHDLVYVSYSGEAVHVHSSWSFGGCEPDGNTYDPAQRCELQSADWFQTCIDATDPTAQLDCMTPANWFAACGEEPVACE